MNSSKLLDCTLRDGGFVNGWKFGHGCINNIVERLDNANIDIIEIGYLRDDAIYDQNSTEFPNTWQIGETINRRQHNNMMVALMDYGCFSIERIGLKSESIIDGIRITFKKSEIDEALKFGNSIKEKGYLLFFQPVAITEYSASEIIYLVEKMNKIDPYAVCMVDTYGFMSKRDLMKYFYLFDSNLAANIYLGYHSHNNYQLSYANAIELLEQPSKRNLIIDASVFGMGKGAGNLNTELIISYLNENNNGDYNINQVLEIISIYLDKERNRNFWGYNLKYYLSATNDCHHEYVQFLLEKKTLTIESICLILSSIPAENKIKYNEDYIRTLYEAFQNNLICDTCAINSLKKTCKEKEILVLAPGASIDTERERIRNFIDEKTPIVISVNHDIKLYKQDFIFVSNSIRYSQLEANNLKIEDGKKKIIATSNISPIMLAPDYVINYSDLQDDEFRELTNATLQLLRLLIKLNVKKATIAGFDGYEDEGRNYYDLGISLEDNLGKNNDVIKKALEKIKDRISVHFVTDSIYAEEGK